MNKVDVEKRLAWYAKMNEIAQAMADEDWDELKLWEKANLNGRSVGTSDWPGWERLGLEPMEVGP